MVNNSETPIISIIVPVYKAEQYLTRCLDSIISQTFTDWECILIDDGSPDNSGIICDDYAIKDCRFKSVHKQNEGVSVARNLGIELAKGKWIGFVDSDDWIESETYEIAVKTAEENNADIVQWRWIEEFNCVPKINKKYIYTNCGEITFEDTCICCESRSMCNKLVLRDFLYFSMIRFEPKLKFLEDTFVSFQLLSKMRKGYQLNNSFYHYSMNPSSATHSINNSIVLNQISSVNFIVDFLQRQTSIGGRNIQEVINKLKSESKTLALLNLDIELCRATFPEVQRYVLYQPTKLTLIHWFVFLHMDFLAIFLIKVWKKLFHF